MNAHEVVEQLAQQFDDAIVIPLPPKRVCAGGCGTVLNRYNKSELCCACHRKIMDGLTKHEGTPIAAARRKRNDQNSGRHRATASRAFVTTAGPKTMDPKKCNAIGCENTLTERNKSGYCTKHIYLKYSTKNAGSNSAPRKTAAEPPVPEVASDSKVKLEFTEQELDRMFVSLPLDEKAFCIQSYLGAAR